MLFWPYILLLVLAVVFSYGFIDPNFPYPPPRFLHNLVVNDKLVATVIYVFIVLLLFIFYGLVLRKVKNGKIKKARIWKLIFLSAGILFFAFPAFSFDLFNYIATAKVTYFYHENPYIVMPIEIQNEPMLKFLHAANKTALYGPSWILLTAIPHFLGLGTLVLTMFAFKAFVIAFYLGLACLIWKMSKQNIFSLAFFALNPLVVIETLVSGHNDVVMMFFALLSFYLISKQRFLLSVICYWLSILIKYATILLLPVYLYVLFLNYKKKQTEWGKAYFWSAISMYVIFFLSPLREEMYAWYFIWPLAFVALIIPRLSKVEPFKIFARFNLVALSLAFSFGLLFRFAPFIYIREWGGITPLVKITATFLPPLLTLFYLWLKNIYPARLLSL